jgi:hypothetical protein
MRLEPVTIVLLLPAMAVILISLLTLSLLAVVLGATVLLLLPLLSSRVGG